MGHIPTKFGTFQSRHPGELALTKSPPEKRVAKISSVINNSAADCSIRFRSNLIQSLIARHPIRCKRSRSTVKGQGYGVT